MLNGNQAEASSEDGDSHDMSLLAARSPTRYAKRRESELDRILRKLKDIREADATAKNLLMERITTVQQLLEDVRSVDKDLHALRSKYSSGRDLSMEISEFDQAIDSRKSIVTQLAKAPRITKRDSEAIQHIENAIKAFRAVKKELQARKSQCKDFSQRIEAIQLPQTIEWLENQLQLWDHDLASIKRPVENWLLWTESVHE